MKNKIPIAFTTNLKFLDYVAAPINSLLINTSKEYNLDIIILYNDDIDVTEQQKFLEKYQNIGNNVIRFLNISEKYKEYKFDTINLNNRFTNVTLYRLILPDIVDYDKIIYLDVDLIVIGDISELYNIDLGDNYIGAVLDLGIETYTQSHKNIYKVPALYNIDFKKYFNAGILDLNLNKLRSQKDNIIKTVQDIKKITSWPDQDTLNIICVDNVKYIDSTWNSFYKIKNDNAKIIHFNGCKKPWISRNIQYSDLWRKYYEYKFD